MPETDSKLPAKKQAKNRSGAKKKEAPTVKTSAQAGSKTSKILGLLKRPGGASLKEIMKATGWQRHSVHGFLSGAIKKKMGLRLNSVERANGERAYRVIS
jgi:hypothetical protein